MGFVVAYDPSWPQWFAAEREALEPVLAPWAAGPVEHIGSTAIPGMIAKPILDMMAAVRDLPAAAAAENALAALGYSTRPHRPDAVLYVRVDGERDTRHLHLTPPGSPLWIERLTFRDAVRADAELAGEYRALKESLLAAQPEYAAADKRAFVVRVLAAHGIEPIPR